jgi:hypothetical protein
VPAFPALSRAESLSDYSTSSAKRKTGDSIMHRIRARFGLFSVVVCFRALLFSACIGGGVFAARLVRPFESDTRFVPVNRIDELVLASLREAGISPAHLCSDEVFVRRAYLDVTGTLPSAMEVRGFLADRRPDKRAALIEALMNREEFAEYWALKWCDILRVKAEFPINLWPNGVQAYHQWIRDCIRQNLPYDQVVRDLLTSSGSNFRVPAVNFYRALQGHEPSALAAAVALTFMGARIERWPDAQRVGLEAFFSRVAYKGTAEWKEEIVMLDPAPAAPLTAVFPDGRAVRIPPGTDPRQVFAEWLIASDNPWFSRTIVNRIWFWLLGRGVIHEPDDIRPDNPPSNPALLAYLEQELVNTHYDLRHVYRLILNSRTYQQSSIPQSTDARVRDLFGVYPVRQLDAEVLVDALCGIFGPGEEYSSAIPEPFTFIPESNRTIALADGSITSQFLEMFGRPPRDTGFISERNSVPTDAQRLHMLNSTHIQRKIESSWAIRRLIKIANRRPPAVIHGAYLNILSRMPTNEEVAVATAYFDDNGKNLNQHVADLAWALINTTEFLCRH